MGSVGPVSRWELFWVDLDPRRPALVISNDGFNAHFNVVTIVPLTGSRGKRRKVYPFEVFLPRGVAGNAVDSIVMPQQVRTISKMRLLDPIGVLSDPDLKAQIENRLLEHLGIEFEME